MTLNQPLTDHAPNAYGEPSADGEVTQKDTTTMKDEFEEYECVRCRKSVPFFMFARRGVCKRCNAPNAYGEQTKKPRAPTTPPPAEQERPDA